MTETTRNLRTVILETATDWDRRMALLQLQESMNHAEAALVKMLLAQLDVVERTHDWMQTALNRAEDVITSVRTRVDTGQHLNELGEFQSVQPDREILAFETALRSAVKTLQLIEKTLVREVL